MAAFETTWIGYPAPAAPPAADVRPPVETDEVDDVTTVEALSSEERVLYQNQTDHAVFTRDMVEELRRRLREAEARESSGVRLRTPENGLLRDELADEVHHDAMPTPVIALDPLDGLEIDVEEPRHLDELDEVLSVLPELEVALAPNSESNFYAGFDDQHPDGVFVATYERLEIGAPIYVVVHLPAGYRFRTPAVVEWVRPPEVSDAGMPPGLGLKMCGLDQRMRHLIRSYAKHRKPLFWIG